MYIGFFVFSAFATAASSGFSGSGASCAFAGSFAGFASFAGGSAFFASGAADSASGATATSAAAAAHLNVILMIHLSFPPGDGREPEARDRARPP